MTALSVTIVAAAFVGDNLRAHLRVEPLLLQFPAGLRTALFFVLLYARALRPALALDGVPPASRAGHAACQRMEHAMDAYLTEAHLAA